MARTCFNSTESQEQYFNNPHLVFVSSLQQVFSHLSFFLHQPLRLCSKGKNWQLHVNIQEDTAASRVFGWPVPKGATVWRRDQHNSRGRDTAPQPGVGQWAATDHPSWLHKLAGNSGWAKQGQVKLFVCHEGASKMPHDVQQQPELDLHCTSAPAQQWFPFELPIQAPCSSCNACAVWLHPRPALVSHLQTDDTPAFLKTLIIRIFYWLERLLLKLLYNFHFFQPKLRAILLK